MVRSRTDGGQHLLRFGGREHEDQVVGRFLDDLEKRVEPGGANHVRFVHDEDAVARLRGSVEGAVPKIPGVVHATVAGGVEFHDVHRSAAVGR